MWNINKNIEALYLQLEELSTPNDTTKDIDKTIVVIGNFLQIVIGYTQEILQQPEFKSKFYKDFTEEELSAEQVKRLIQDPETKIILENFEAFFSEDKQGLCANGFFCRIYVEMLGSNISLENIIRLFENLGENLTDAAKLVYDSQELSIFFLKNYELNNALIDKICSDPGFLALKGKDKLEFFKKRDQEKSTFEKKLEIVSKSLIIDEAKEKIFNLDIGELAKVNDKMLIDDLTTAVDALQLEIGLAQEKVDKLNETPYVPVKADKNQVSLYHVVRLLRNSGLYDEKNEKRDENFLKTYKENLKAIFTPSEDPKVGYYTGYFSRALKELLYYNVSFENAIKFFENFNECFAEAAEFILKEIRRCPELFEESTTINNLVIKKVGEECEKIGIKGKAKLEFFQQKDEETGKTGFESSIERARTSIEKALAVEEDRRPVAKKTRSDDLNLLEDQTSTERASGPSVAKASSSRAGGDEDEDEIPPTKKTSVEIDLEEAITNYSADSPSTDLFADLFKAGTPEFMMPEPPYPHTEAELPSGESVAQKTPSLQKP